MVNCDIFIVGGGAAGLSAARAAAERHPGHILLADYGPGPGGILCQCAHPGFGPELTGPEYVRQMLEGFPDGVTFSWNTNVLSVGNDRTAVLTDPVNGLRKIRFKQMILATGCREIAPGSLPITGTRPAGIFTAGALQRDMNLYGDVPEGPAVILGSGDMGLVAAWQLVSAGIGIRMMVEQREKSAGLPRGWKRLDGHSVPVRYRSTVSRVFGDERLEGVNVRDLDTGKEEFVPCRTLVVAAGMVPGRDLAQNTGMPEWLHLCGNCRCIHAVVESVVQDGIRAGIAACEELMR